MRATTLILTLLGCLTTACSWNSNHQLARSLGTAPRFSGTDSEGHPISLQALSAKRPVVLHFVEVNCACSRQAAVHMQRLQDTYGDSVAVIGVINAEAEVANRWRQEAKVRFRILTDPWCEVIRAYGVQRSVHTVCISRSADIVSNYPRYNADSLHDLNVQIAALLGVEPKRISTEGAPVKLTAGCTFPE